MVSAVNKIVDLNERRNLSSAESGRMLNDCRELAMKRLSGSLREMLADIEENLFQLAEASYDREMQNLYLEVRGKAKEKWPKIETAFSRHFIDVFNTKIRGEMNSAVKTLSISALELSLVEEDDLSESIAMQSLATRLREQNEDELSLLGERVGMLLGKNELKDEENPISPQAVCDSLKHACEEIEGGVKVRLILLKQIEQHVAKSLNAVYRDLNSEMVRWNVLPNLRSAYRKPVGSVSIPRGQARGESTGDASAQQRGDAAGGDLMAILQQLLQSPMLGQPQDAVLPGLTFGTAGGTASPDSRQTQFIDSLTEMQRQVLPAQEGVGSVGVIEPGQVVGAINVLHQIKANSSAQGVGQLDAITIDIVAMLFDFIFDDTKIPDAIKALVGRLQIPVLKVAMLDRTFFSSKNHPARRLLDGVSQASLAWGGDVDQDDPLFQEIVQIVDQIQNDFERNVDVFNEALERLQIAIDKRDAAAESIAERSADLMQKREAEEIAWVVAGEAVMRRLTSSVPTGVQRFLLDHWQFVLKELHLRHGEEHHAYLSSLAMMDDLIWSVAPKTGSDERKQLVNTLPGLLRAMNQGLDVIELPQEIRGNFFDELVTLHSAAVKAGLGGMESAPVDIETPMQAQSVMDAAARESSDQYSVNPEGELFITRITENDVQIDEVALVGASQQSTPEADFHLEKVSMLNRGDWVEFRQEEGPSMRARLSWVSPQRGIFLFTNPRSPRAMSISKEALAYQVRIGKAEIVVEQPLFERAVSGVLESFSMNN